MSDSLRHFPEYHPVPKNIPPAKVEAQAKLDADKAEFKARGGEIQRVDSSANRNPKFILGNVIRPDNRIGKTW
jgi:hypothetical protein